MYGAFSAIDYYGSHQGLQFDFLKLLGVVGLGLFIVFLDVMQSSEAASFPRVVEVDRSLLQRFAAPAGDTIFSAFCYVSLLLSIWAVKTMSLSYVAYAALTLITPLFLSPLSRKAIPQQFLESTLLARIIMMVEFASLTATIISLFRAQ